MKSGQCSPCAIAEELAGLSLPLLLILLCHILLFLVGRKSAPDTSTADCTLLLHKLLSPARTTSAMSNLHVGSHHHLSLLPLLIDS